MAENTEKKTQAEVWVVADPRGLNLREKPKGAILEILPTGTEVEVTKKDGAWFKVKVSKKTNGWVMAEFLCQKEDANDAGECAAAPEELVSGA